MIDSEYLTQRQAAEYLQQSVRTVRSLTKDGDLPHARLSTRVIRYRKQDLDRWFEGKMRAGAPAIAPPERQALNEPAKNGSFES